MKKPRRYFTRRGTFVQEVAYVVPGGRTFKYIWTAYRVPKQYIHKGRKP